MPVEVYRLTLEHFMECGEDRIRIEEPVVAQIVLDRRFAPSPVCVNQLFEKLKSFYLDRMTQ